MAEAGDDWLAPLPPRLQGPLSRAAAGLPANVGLMHILMECSQPGEAEAALAEAIARLRERAQAAEADRLAAALELLRRNPQAFGVVRGILGGLDHDAAEADGVAYWAAAFDQAARTHPEGSVALYALGNPGLLEAATAEVVARLEDWGVLPGTAECLDIGCGIGRMEVALASRIRRIVGIDIAAEMVEAARRRCAGLANVEIRQASGRDLAGFPDASFDLVLAVDSFPYLVQGGANLAQGMVREAARVLRAGGRLVILNFSYRGDLQLDRAEVALAAAATGLSVLRNGTSEFTLWDGAAFELGKPQRLPGPYGSI